MTTATAPSGLFRRAAKPRQISVTASPPPLSGPVLIGDVATPAGGETLLSLMLKAGRDAADE